MGKFLGELEEVVMRAILFMNNRTYGVEIRYAILDKTRKDVSFGSIYSTLERLEKKGFVSSETGEPTEERGGRAKRYYRVEAKGMEVLRSAEAARQSFASPLIGLLKSGLNFSGGRP